MSIRACNPDDECIYVQNKWFHFQNWFNSTFVEWGVMNISNKIHRKNIMIKHWHFFPETLQHTTRIPVHIARRGSLPPIPPRFRRWGRQQWQRLALQGGGGRSPTPAARQRGQAGARRRHAAHGDLRSHGRRPVWRHGLCDHVNKEIKQRVDTKIVFDILITALWYMLACEEVGEEVQESKNATEKKD